MTFVEGGGLGSVNQKIWFNLQFHLETPVPSRGRSGCFHNYSLVLSVGFYVLFTRCKALE